MWSKDMGKMKIEQKVYKGITVWMEKRVIIVFELLIETPYTA